MRRLLPATAVAVLLLSGCGVQGLQWHPGIAATVGDQTITNKRVDDLVGGFCDAIASQAKTSGQASQPEQQRSYVTGAAEVLVVKAAAEQLAKSYGVGPGDTYNQAVGQFQSAVTKLPASQADAYVTLRSAGPYITGVLTSVGGKRLSDKGVSGATDDQKSAEGAKALTSWFRSHTVDINPRYGFRIDDGQPGVVDGDTSFAVSSTAKQGANTNGAAADYVAALPSSQVCG